MQTLDVTFTVEQIMHLVKQLPSSIKLRLIQDWSKELNIEIPPLPSFDIVAWEDELDLSKYAIKESSIAPLQQLWQNEPSVKELNAMLTS